MNGRYLVLSGGQFSDQCGAGGGPAVTNQAWPNCGPEFVIGPPWVQTANLKVWVWGRWVGRVNQFSPNSRYKPGFAYSPDPALQAQGIPFRVGYAGLPVPGLHPAVSPGQQPRVNPGIPTVPATLPRWIMPRIPNIPGLRDSYYPPNARYQPGTGQRPWPRGRENPGQRPRPGENPDRPPRPREHERKVRVGGALATALTAAHAATEAADIAEALFEALPAHIRATVPRSGRTQRGARVGEGVRYATPYDRAMHVWRNLQHLNVSQALMNLLRNHLTDLALGRLNAGADRFSNRNLGGARWVNR